ncbi:hypothetical protein BH20ACT24_BH20ACT24_02260 [soil metagenome]
MRVEVIEDPRAFVAEDWSEVVAADPGGTFFHTPGYLKVWWEEFGAGAPVIALLKDGRRTVAAAAFECDDGVLRFLGGFDVTDYMGPVAIPGREAVAAKELLSAVGGLPWQRADLRGMPVRSAWYSALESAAVSHRYATERSSDGVAPMLALPARYAAYLAYLPPKLRHELERKRRRLTREGGGHRLRRSTADTLTADLDRFLQLHRSAGGAKAKFMHPDMELFFRRLGEAFLPGDVFRLTFLEIGGVSAAAAIGFAFGGTFSLYNSAFDRSFASLSPGTVLVSELIEAAIEEGMNAFDLLKGDLGYKYRFGALPRQVGRLRITR